MLLCEQTRFRGFPSCHDAAAVGELCCVWQGALLRSSVSLIRTSSLRKRCVIVPLLPTTIIAIRTCTRPQKISILASPEPSRALLWLHECTFARLQCVKMTARRAWEAGGRRAEPSRKRRDVRRGAVKKPFNSRRLKKPRRKGAGIGRSTVKSQGGPRAISRMKRRAAVSRAITNSS